MTTNIHVFYVYTPQHIEDVLIHWRHHRSSECGPAVALALGEHCTDVIKWPFKKLVKVAKDYIINK